MYFCHVFWLKIAKRRHITTSGSHVPANPISACPMATYRQRTSYLPRSGCQAEGARSPCRIA